MRNWAQPEEDGEQLLTRVQSLLPLHGGPVTKLLEVGSPRNISCRRLSRATPTSLSWGQGTPGR